LDQIIKQIAEKKEVGTDERLLVSRVPRTLEHGLRT
jgi:hypothetical protein